MENTEKQAQDIASELAETKRQLAAAQAAMSKSGVPAPLNGSYKGFTFVPGHRRVRDRNGEICDTQMLLDGAAQGDPAACERLDWLIQIQYGYLVPAAAEPAKKQK